MEQTARALLPGAHIATTAVPRERLAHSDLQAWDSDSSSSGQSGALRRRHDHHSSPFPQQHQPVAVRSWWARVLVDAMLVPFVQGFMLNLGVHWVQYWRSTGGLLGLFRSWRYYRKDRA
ncbi:hypothetical protein GGI11_007754 [Coemansia sp. RSA 2049]|nr:hypothetical protein GGI11_007754 [Coemansia sp. RSA 2049]KAJ2507576.1 hypothetical protein H4217_008764 [Coemansia sp. RSA 1939]KAJ2613824.1 hypothetical protein EV177_002357 [Coemansia sp. RSA 1804]KAJ2668760.1 hypothetical protein GGH99_006415 [Coemansia sp. RSA 1285]